MDSTKITLPPGSDVRLCQIASFNLVLVAPPGAKAEPEMLFKPGVAGLFTFDPGLTWPDHSGCAAATAYLTAGHPIALQFETLADAMVCHARFKALVH